MIDKNYNVNHVLINSRLIMSQLSVFDCTYTFVLLHPSSSSFGTILLQLLLLSVRFSLSLSSPKGGKEEEEG